MALQVIGAGFGRTGTLSLKYALEKLGFSKCYHMMEVFANDNHVSRWREAGRGEPIDWDALFTGYQAAVDWPSCNFWEAQLAQFPEAKVLLSERDPERWYKSVMSTIYPFSVAGRKAQDPAVRARVEMAFEVIWDALFEGRMDDKEHVIGVYLA
ncbi:MAG: sulfotransferase family protein, partial [Gammaproteobacteria bacterium]